MTWMPLEWVKTQKTQAIQMTQKRMTRMTHNWHESNDSNNLNNSNKSKNSSWTIRIKYLNFRYIFENFGGETIKSKEGHAIPFFYGLYVTFSVVIIGFVLRDWRADLHDLIRVNHSTADNQDADRAEALEENTSLQCKQILGLVLSNWIEVLLISALMVILFGGTSVLYIALIILTALLVVREFFQVRKSSIILSA